MRPLRGLVKEREQLEREPASPQFQVAKAAHQVGEAGDLIEIDFHDEAGSGGHIQLGRGNLDSRFTPIPNAPK